MKLKPTLSEARQNAPRRVAKEVLGGDYVSIEIGERFEIQEDIEKNETSIFCKVELNTANTGSHVTVKGTGTGPIHALCTTVKKELMSEYNSLDRIRFSEFAVNAELGRRPNYVLDASGSSAPVEAILVVTNERDQDFIFRNKSKSMNKAAINVVLQAVEHFINSEKAVVRLRDYVKDASKRNRGDLVDRYVRQLSELVKNTSYEKVLQK